MVTCHVKRKGTTIHMPTCDRIHRDIWLHAVYKCMYINEDISIQLKNQRLKRAKGRRNLECDHTTKHCLTV